MRSCHGDLMTISTMAKRTAAGTLALAVCLGGGALALAGSANATQNTNVNLVVVSGEDAHLIDAVNAAPLASVMQVPILALPDSGVSESQCDSLHKRGPQWLYFVGGDAALSPAIRAEVIRCATIDATSGAAREYRIAGDTRYSTNGEIIKTIDAFQGRGFNG